jgi:hypothetical protein
LIARIASEDLEGELALEVNFASAGFGSRPGVSPGSVAGLLFHDILANSVANRVQIVYHILLKATYCGISGHNWLTSNIPSI